MYMGTFEGTPVW